MNTGKKIKLGKQCYDGLSMSSIQHASNTFFSDAPTSLEGDVNPVIPTSRLAQPSVKIQRCSASSDTRSVNASVGVIVVIVVVWLAVLTAETPRNASEPATAVTPFSWFSWFKLGR